MKLNYRSFGGGESLIILHGLLGSSDNWQSIAKNLAEEYKVYIVDQRNHGKSPHSEIMNYRAMSEDIAELMAEEGLIETNILGHSMGGKTAMQFALDHPGVVSKLIVVDIAPKEYKPHHDEIFKALLSVPLEKMNRRSEVDEFLAESITQEDVRLFLMKGLTRGEGGRFEWKFNLEILFKCYKEIVNIPQGESYHGESLFIRGGNSKYIQDEDWEGIVEMFPLAKLQTINDAGHWLHAQKPMEVVDAVKEFIQ